MLFSTTESIGVDGDLMRSIVILQTGPSQKELDKLGFPTQLWPFGDETLHSRLYIPCQAMPDILEALTKLEQ